MTETTPAIVDAVQAYADAVTDHLDDYMRRHDVDDETLETREYRSMMAALDELDSEFERIVTEDMMAFDQFWSLVGSIMGGTRSFQKERMPLSATADDTVARTRELLAELRRRITDEVIIHLDVPEELAETSQLWDTAAIKAQEASTAMPSVRRVSGWRGDAATVYKEMAGVQAAAQEEYVHLPRAMADAYDVIGTLNRAVLIAVHDALRTTLLEARGGVDVMPGLFFGAIQRFERAVDRCLTELLPEALDISGEARDEVTTILDDVLRRLNVIDQTWPTGTSRAGRAAGDTAAPELTQHC